MMPLTAQGSPYRRITADGEGRTRAGKGKARNDVKIKLHDMQELMNKIDLNNFIYVKLTDAGFNHWFRKYNEIMPPKFRQLPSWFREKADKEGHVKFQLWEFMNFFGDQMYQTAPAMIEDNAIYIQY